VVRTRAGRVRGFIDGDLQVFRGIRYGADTAPRRFSRPCEPTPGAASSRRGIRRGSRQPGRSRTSRKIACFSMCAPIAAAAPRPVIVYIHGGAYSSGSGSSPLYDGANLCRRGDVVVVTVNHRSSLFGTSICRASRTRAMPECSTWCCAALGARQHRGVRRDPGCVTLLGQSGGGAKIATLMAMPAAPGCSTARSP
jgi:para-nitrobenzyl esterase